ncbi:MAG: hypothetical protein FIA95_15425, partial [Gemmatimonadetes bacterium]|nr:hypothetical protein [Gemmatimonadota bacterium]
MLTFLLSCSLLGAGQSVLAPADTLPRASQGADTLRVYEVMALTVTAMRTSIPLRLNPGATTVVDDRHLTVMPRGIAVDAAVRLVPGVKVDNQADGERVHMSNRGQGILSERGLRGIKVMHDGLPLNDPTGFASDVYDVDWSDVSRIEVLRGPGAALYGGGATAGVLNIVTTPPPSAGEPDVYSAEARVGSHGFWKTAARNAGRSGNVGWALDASRTEGDGYRDHTEFDATNVRGKAEIAAGDKLTLRPVFAWTSFFNENAEGLNLNWLAENRRQANPDANTFDEYQFTRRFVGGLVGTYDLGTGATLDFNGYLRETRYKEPVPSSVQHRSLRAPGATMQLTKRARRGTVTHTLAAGADVQWQRISEYRRANLGGAVEGVAKLSD